MRGINQRRFIRMERAAHTLSGLLNEIYEEASEYLDSRSDKWHESERGFAFDEWLGLLDNLKTEAENLTNIPQSPEDI